MKKSLLALIATATLLTAAIIPFAAQASISHSSNGSSHITSDQTIDDDLYITGKDVVVEGTVNGDVYAAGSTVTIKGTVNGDVFAAGQDVFIGGNVKGSVRTAGNTVRWGGATIAGGGSDFSNTFTAEKDTTVAGGLNFATNTAAVRASVGKSLVAGGNDVTLGSSIGKDVEAGAHNLTLENTSVVNGNLHTYGDTQVHKDNGATVKGSTTHSAAPHKRHESHAKPTILLAIWTILSLYLVGALLLWLLPVLPRRVSEAIAGRPLPALGFGLLALIVTIPILVVVAITIIGIPVALIGGVLFAAAIFAAPLFVSLALGEAVAARFQWSRNPYADLFVGILVLTLIELIPVVGALIHLLVILLGLGGLVLVALASRHRHKPAAAHAARKSA